MRSERVAPGSCGSTSPQIQSSLTRRYGASRWLPAGAEQAGAEQAGAEQVVVRLPTVPPLVDFGSVHEQDHEYHDQEDDDADTSRTPDARAAAAAVVVGLPR